MWAQKNERKNEKNETRTVSRSSSSSRQRMGREEGGGVAGKFSILLGKSTRQEAP